MPSANTDYYCIKDEEDEYISGWASSTNGLFVKKSGAKSFKTKLINEIKQAGQRQLLTARMTTREKTRLQEQTQETVTRIENYKIVKVRIIEVD